MVVDANGASIAPSGRGACTSGVLNEKSDPPKESNAGMVVGGVDPRTWTWSAVNGWNVASNEALGWVEIVEAARPAA